VWLLVSKMIQLALSRFGSSAAVRIGGAAVVGDVTLDWLRQRAIEIAPGSDAAALEEAARTAARMLGLENDEVLWPRRRDGEPIVPKYFVMDIGRGRAWMATRYYSRKSVRSAARPRIARPRGVARYR